MVSNLPTSTSSLFLGSVPDITYSNINGTIYIVLEVISSGSSVASLTEVYTPNINGEVILQGLKDLLKPYIWDNIVLRCPSSASGRFKNLQLKITATDSSGAINHDIAIYPSLGVVNESPSSYHKNFTDQKNRICYWRQPETVALNMKLNHVLKLNYLNGNSISTITKSISSDASDYLVLDVSATSMVRRMGLSGTKAPDAVSLVISSSYAGSVTDTIRVDYTRELKGDVVSLLHANYYGLPEVLTFHGADRQKPRIESSFAYMNGVFRRYNYHNSIEHVTNTGYLTKERYAALNDLLVSPQVFEVSIDDEETLVGREVTVTDLDGEFVKQRTELRNAAITYRYSADDYRSADWYPTLMQRIFDYTFDYSFN